MNLEWVHPGIVLIAGAWSLPLFSGTRKRFVMVALPSVALVICLLMKPGTYGEFQFLHQELVFRSSRSTESSFLLCLFLPVAPRDGLCASRE